MPRDPEKLERNERIIALRLRGKKLEEIAEMEGLSRQRVQYILAREEQRRWTRRGGQ